MDDLLKQARDALVELNQYMMPKAQASTPAGMRLQIAQSVLLVAIADRLLEGPLAVCGNDDSGYVGYPCVLGSGHSGNHLDADGDTWVQ